MNLTQTAHSRGSDMARQRKEHLKVSLEFFCFEQDNRWIAYCPALRLSTYGDTLEEAAEMFPEALEILLEDLIESGKLEKVLVSLGWSLKPTKYAPPPTRKREIHTFGDHTARTQNILIPSAGTDGQLAIA